MMLAPPVFGLHPLHARSTPGWSGSFPVACGGTARSDTPERLPGPRGLGIIAVNRSSFSIAGAAAPTANAVAAASFARNVMDGGVGVTK